MRDPRALLSCKPHTDLVGLGKGRARAPKSFSQSDILFKCGGKPSHRAGDAQGFAVLHAGARWVSGCHRFGARQGQHRGSLPLWMAAGFDC